MEGGSLNGLSIREHNRKLESTKKLAANVRPTLPSLCKTLEKRETDFSNGALSLGD